MKLKIAMLQLMSGNTLQDQLTIGTRGCELACANGADIAVFPEMWSTGYNVPQSQSALQASALTAEDDFIMHFKKLAKTLQMAIAITFLERYNDSFRNSVILFDRRGERQFLYAKVHTCDFGDESVLESGDDFYVTNLDIKIGKLKVGAMICFDREFPESARILMLKGAELIIVPNACDMEINRLSQLRGRAYENMLAIATACYPLNGGCGNGRSTLFDGVSFVKDGNSFKSRDMKVFEAPADEGVYIAELDLALLREYRAREVHGNAYRKVAKYQKLLDEQVEAPFIRPDNKRTQ